MAGSKYDPFWVKRKQIIIQAMNKVAETGRKIIVPCPGISDFGERKSWSGSVDILNGKIISGGTMAHMQALGKLLAQETDRFSGVQFHFSMNNRYVLSVMRGKPRLKLLLSNRVAGNESISLPNSCSDFHRYANELPRYHYPVNLDNLPTDGIYILFESGEYAHGGDRIVYVGTHRADGRLSERLNTHYTGHRSNSTFRNHLGESLDRKTGVNIYR